MRFDPIPDPGTVNHDDEEQDSYVIQMKITLEDKNTRNMFSVHQVMGKGKWGFPLSQKYCYDLNRYFQLVKPGDKAFANTQSCLRKIVRVVTTLDDEKCGRLLELARPGGLFIFIVAPEILQMFIHHYSAHNLTSSICNYILQLKGFIVNYWECHSAIIMDRDHHGSTGSNWTRDHS
jgi:hypothetical protein